MFVYLCYINSEEECGIVLLKWYPEVSKSEGFLAGCNEGLEKANGKAHGT